MYLHHVLCHIYLYCSPYFSQCCQMNVQPPTILCIIVFRICKAVIFNINDQQN